MKKIMAMLLATSFLFACTSQSEKENKAAPETTIKTQEVHEEKATELTLNNGAKWKADSTTLQNVVLLKTVVSGAKKESLENYIQTAKQLQDGLNKMIAECKMKGPDHDALHHWLEPLIEKTRDLEKATSKENAATIFGEIEKQLSLFDTYFS